MDPTCAYSEKISLVSYKLETICLLCFSTLPSTCVYHETAGMLAEASNKVKKKKKKTVRNVPVRFARVYEPLSHLIICCLAGSPTNTTSKS